MYAHTLGCFFEASGNGDVGYRVAPLSWCRGQRQQLATKVFKCKEWSSRGDHSAPGFGVGVCVCVAVWGCDGGQPWLLSARCVWAAVA